jgi:hypothetical protein
MGRKFQIIQKVVTRAGELIVVDSDLDKNYNFVDEIAIFTDPDYGINRNCELAESMTIDDGEVFPRRFATALLHPQMANPVYREVKSCLSGKSKLRTTLRDLSSSLSEPYAIQILVTLDNR